MLAVAFAHAADPGLTLRGSVVCEGEICTLHARFVNTRPYARVLLDPLVYGLVIAFPPWFSLRADPPSPLLFGPVSRNYDLWFRSFEVPAEGERDFLVRLDGCVSLPPGQAAPTETLRYDTRVETLADAPVHAEHSSTGVLTWARRHGAFRGVLVSEPFSVPCAPGWLGPQQPKLRVLAP